MTVELENDGVFALGSPRLRAFLVKYRAVSQTTMEVAALEELDGLTKEQFCANQKTWFNQAKERFWEHHNAILNVGVIELVENFLGLSDSMLNHYVQMESALSAMAALSDNYTRAGC